MLSRAQDAGACTLAVSQVVLRRRWGGGSRTDRSKGHRSSQLGGPDRPGRGSRDGRRPRMEAEMGRRQPNRSLDGARELTAD